MTLMDEYIFYWYDKTRYLYLKKKDFGQLCAHCNSLNKYPQVDVISPVVFVS